MAAAAYAGVLYRRTAAVASGSDSSGYLNLTELLLEGRVDRPLRGLAIANFGGDLARIFIPLGFVPGRTPGTMAPFYPLGFPLEMAAAEALTGLPAARFAVVPASAAAFLVLVFLLGRELGLSRLSALLAAGLCACFPTTLFMGVQPMSDLPAALWAAAAVWAALRGRRASGRPGLWLAMFSGVAFGLGVLVRPTNALLILPLALALPPRWPHWLFFLAGGAPAAVLFAAFGLLAYGAPFATGYGSMAEALAVENFPSRIVHYGYWMARLSGFWMPLFWLASAFDRRIDGRTRALLLAWPSVFVLFYSLYGPYEAWWYTRYLLPALPAVVIAALRTLGHLSEGLSRLRAWAPALGVALAAGLTAVVEVRFARAEAVLRVYRADQAYPRACWLLAARTEPRSVVVAMQMSGAIEYYTDRIYAMWNWMDREKFAMVRAHAERSGYRLYALLASFETEEAMARLGGSWSLVGSEANVRLLKLE